MKKLFATLMLLTAVSFAFAGKAGDSDGAIENPKSQYALCHDQNGKWDPQSKSCDPYACGCLFHQIEEFIMDIFS
ncbi:MAG: hypothetical protein IPN69_17160 [Acidobacteria bacterium]|nr:hypothetical protein [Acidobacteriota bacterium]MBK8147004.1 hypothetical protein [Acidobacteriota bacterium]MBK8812440.1 hypothetical protein [Acidobacteriota bacterium]